MDSPAQFFSYTTANGVRAHIRLEIIAKVYDTGDRLDFWADGERHELTEADDRTRLLAALGIER